MPFAYWESVDSRRVLRYVSEESIGMRKPDEWVEAEIEFLPDRDEVWDGARLRFDRIEDVETEDVIDLILAHESLGRLSPLLKNRLKAYLEIVIPEGSRKPWPRSSYQDRQ